MGKERVPWSEEKRKYFRDYHRVRRDAIKAGTWAYRHRQMQPAEPPAPAAVQETPAPHE